MNSFDTKQTQSNNIFLYNKIICAFIFNQPFVQFLVFYFLYISYFTSHTIGRLCFLLSPNDITPLFLVSSFYIFVSPFSFHFITYNFLFIFRLPFLIGLRFSWYFTRSKKKYISLIISRTRQRSAITSRIDIDKTKNHMCLLNELSLIFYRFIFILFFYLQNYGVEKLKKFGNVWWICRWEIFGLFFWKKMFAWGRAIYRWSMAFYIVVISMDMNNVYSTVTLDNIIKTEIARTKGLPTITLQKYFFFLVLSCVWYITGMFPWALTLVDSYCTRHFFYFLLYFSSLFHFSSWVFSTLFFGHGMSL